MLGATFWDQVPVLNTKVDFTNLPVVLDEQDVFVLSRVNGMMSLREMSETIRVERLDLERILGKLVKYDLLLLPDKRAKKALLDEVTGRAAETEEFPGAREVEQAAREATRKERAAAAAVAEAGRWDRDTLFGLLNRLHVERRTGVLRCLRDAENFKALFFQDGALVNVSSVPFQAAECLGRVIQRAGFLEQTKVIESLRRAQQSGRLQGVELLEMGAVTAKRMDEMMRVHVEVKLSTLVDWAAGSYTFQPLPELSERIARIDLDFPRLMFNLIWKRYPLAEIGHALDKRLELFVGATENPPYEIADFGFGDSLSKFCGIITERDNPLKRMLIVSNLKTEQTQRMIWALYLNGLIDFFTASREDRTLARIQELTEQLKGFEKATYFEIIGVHWTANDEMIKRVYKVKHEEQTAAVRNSIGLEQQLNRKYLAHVEHAFEVLKDQAGRRAYRSEIFDPDFIEFGSDILRQKGESYLFTKDDLEQAIVEFESALEVYERNGEYWAEMGLAYFFRDYLRDTRGAARARQLVKRGIAMTPNSEVTNLCLGLMFRHEKKNKLALEALERVLKINEKSLFAKIVIAEIKTGKSHEERQRAVREFVERQGRAERDFDEMMEEKRRAAARKGKPAKKPGSPAAH